MEFIAVTVALAGILGVGLLVWHRRSSTPPAPDTAQAPAVPQASIPELVEQIRGLRLQVNDLRLRRTIGQACDDTLKFFRDLEQRDPDKLSSFKHEYLGPQGHLVMIHSILLAFIRAEDDQTFPERDYILKEGPASLKSYAENVKDNIARVGKADLIPFRVQNQMVQALKYR
jgi:hypothetical protein